MSKQKILIVDDTEAGLFALEQVLLKVDAEVVEAASGREALAAAQEQDFALAILDVMMPGMDGYELAERLRNDERTRAIPIIFLTGFRYEENDQFRGYEAGCVDFIIKPYAPDVLIGKVRALLNMERDREAMEAHSTLLEGIVEDQTEALQHRVREMRYLYALSSLVAEPRDLLADTLQAAVNLIPSGWQYPEAACARIRLEDRQFTTRNFRETPWRQSAEITLSGQTVGTVEVGYLREQPPGSEGPFLTEERDLINDTARQLAILIRRHQAEQEVARLASFPTENPNPILRVGLDMKLLYANEAAAPILAAWGCRTGDHVPEDIQERLAGVVTAGRVVKAEEVYGGMVWWVAWTPFAEAGYANIYAVDITSRKKMEEALARSEMQLSDALKMSRAGHWELDVARGVFTFNDNFYRIFRTTAAEVGNYEMPAAEYARRFCHPDDAYLVADELNVALQSSDPNFSRQAEHRIFYADGEPGYITVRFSAVRDAHGRVVKTYGVNQDITERKRSEESLRLFRTLIDHSGEAVEVLDPETGRILDANERAWADTGYTREEFLSLRVGDIDPYVADSAEFAARLARLREAGSADMESVHRRKDGTLFPVNVHMKYVRLDRDYIVSVVRDLTARREAEAEYRTILATASDGFWTADAAGHLLDVNDAFCQLTGYGRDELLRMGIGDLEVTETEEETAAHLRRIIAAGSDRFETRLRAKDGRVLAVEISVNYLDVGGGRFFVFARDITDRKRMEEERDRLQAQLLQAQKMEAVGRLAGGVAHDFNNLLMGIRGFAGFARDTAEAGSQAHGDLTEVLSLTDRAAGLTRQLLAFSRRQTLAPVLVDLNALVTDQAKLLARLLGEDIELSFVPARNLGIVRADPGQIEQVVMNLAVNARDAMPDGGRLTIETANVTLGDDYARSHPAITPGAYVMLAVSDTGCGMDEEIRAQLFEPFFTTKELGKGTGLGLSTVYGIVEQHKGSIWVYSEPDKGTTFKVYLPRVPADVQDDAEGSDFVVGGNETILLVEDSDAVRDVGRRHLEAIGYHVICAAGPGQAEDVARAHEDCIDLLLTDVVMPDRSGRELYESLCCERPGLKVLYMSGYTGDTVLNRGVLDEGVPFLQKPFERKGLAAKVRQALDR